MMHMFDGGRKRIGAEFFLYDKYGFVFCPHFLERCDYCTNDASWENIPWEATLRGLTGDEADDWIAREEAKSLKVQKNRRNPTSPMQGFDPICCWFDRRDEWPEGEQGEHVSPLTEDGYRCLWTQTWDKSALMVCSGCDMAMYCSKECQRRHWQSHKEECLDMRAQAEEAKGSSSSSGGNTSKGKSKSKAKGKKR